MKPKPFSGLNHCTVPCATADPRCLRWPRSAGRRAPRLAGSERRCGAGPRPAVSPAGALAAARRAYLVRLRPARAGRRAVLHPLALVEGAEASRVGDGGEVDEDVVAAVLGLDEPETLGRVEPPDRSDCH